MVYSTDFQAECTNMYRAAVEGLSALWYEIGSEQSQKAAKDVDATGRPEAERKPFKRRGIRGKSSHNGGPSKGQDDDRYDTRAKPTIANTATATKISNIHNPKQAAES
ncbi:MAG: hypothetical protein M1830_008267 [Pleopsidium flavum]|nr:MAG: hypothetical protein M1830_008267 [Pleopsidium flavum]